MRNTMLAAGAAAALAAGCGHRPDNEVHVTGSVTLGGRPIHSGRVYFTPDRAKGNDGPQGVALISGGRFDTRGAGGRPAPPGPVVVRVDGYDAPNPGAADGACVVWEYLVPRDLPREDSALDITIPESARAKPAKAAASP